LSDVMSGWGSRDFGVDISGGEYQGWILAEVNIRGGYYRR